MMRTGYGYSQAFRVPVSRGAIVGPSDRPRFTMRGIAAVTPAGDALTGFAVIGTQLMGLGGSALYGGAIGGIAAHSWKGAGTGALAGASIAALSYGGMDLMMGAYLPGALLLGAGAVGGYLTYRRWSGKGRGGKVRLFRKKRR
jgi:hypothetical protein